MSLINKIVHKLSGGYFNPAGLTDVSSAGVITNRDMYQTHSGVARIYTIEAMKFEKTDQVLSCINKSISLIHKEIQMKSFISVENVFPPINNPVFIQRMNRTLDVYQGRKDAYEKMSQEQQTTGVHFDTGIRRFRYGKKDLAKDQRKYESYTEVHNHVRDNDGAFFHVRIVIHVVFPDRTSMDANESRVEKAIQKEVDSASQVEKHIAKLMLNYTPSVAGVTSMKIDPILTHEAGLTNMLPYKDEGILSDKGILIGMNVENYTPAFLDVFGSPVGSSSLIAGKAGRGKSALAFYYTSQLVANNVTVVYIDLKGTEVTEVLSQISSNIYTVDFGHNNSTYVNTMRISKNVPDYTYADAITITSQMLSIFVALLPDEGSQQDLLVVLEGAVKSYYNTMGVSEDNIDTYENTKEMSYLTLMQYIGLQRENGTKKDLDNLFSIIERRLPSAIINYGLDKLDNSIDLDQLFKYDIVVFSMNKNQETTLTLIDQVRVYMALMVTKRIAKFNKKNGLFTTVMAEEAQRYGGLPILSQGISDLASGSRSDNLNVCMIMNDLSVLERPEFSGFRANIANYMIGDCDGNAVDLIANTFKKPDLAQKVSEIIAQPKKYNYTFATYFDNGLEQLLYKMRCNASKSMLAKFKTRDIQEGGDAS